MNSFLALQKAVSIIFLASILLYALVLYFFQWTFVWSNPLFITIYCWPTEIRKKTKQNKSRTRARWCNRKTWNSPPSTDICVWRIKLTEYLLNVGRRAHKTKMQERSPNNRVGEKKEKGNWDRICTPGRELRKRKCSLTQENASPAGEISVERKRASEAWERIQQLVCNK